MRFMNYEGAQVKLRPLRIEDLGRLQSWKNDAFVRDSSMGYRFGVTEPMERTWLENVLKGDSDALTYGIVDKESDELVGYEQLLRIDWISRTAIFGIKIGAQSARGKGHAVEAMTLLFRHGFEVLNLRKIGLEVLAFNQRAVDLYLRFGFVEEGRLGGQVYLGNSYHDLVLMGLFDDVFRKRYSLDDN